MGLRWYVARGAPHQPAQAVRLIAHKLRLTGLVLRSLGVLLGVLMGVQSGGGAGHAGDLGPQAGHVKAGLLACEISQA